MRIGKTKNKTFFLSFGSILFRYFLLAVPLIIAIKLDQYNFFSVIFGIFMVQLVILADHFFGLILSARKTSIGEIMEDLGRIHQLIVPFFGHNMTFNLEVM